MIIWSLALNELNDENDRERAGALFEKYQNAMYWTAYDIVKNNADAEDAVMNAACNICRCYDAFIALSGNDLRRKLITIVKNAAIDIYRKNQKQATLSLDERLYDDDEGDVPDGSELTFLPEDFGKLQKYVMTLKEQYKIVLIMRYVDQMSEKEIAHMLGKPESTISTQIRRGISKLNEMLIKEQKSHE